MGKGLLFSVIGGIGDAVAKSAGSYQKFLDDRELLEERAALEEQKLLRIDEAKRARDRAPLTRLEASAQKYAQEDVPVTAAPVTALSGNDPDSELSKDHPAADGKGLVGIDRKRVLALPDSNEHKADLLAQLDRQFSSDQRTAQDAVAGQTRKRTSDEALSAAIENSKLTDLEAYGAGKKIAADKYMQVAEGASLWDTTTGKLVFANSSKADRQQLMEEARDERARRAEEGRDRRHSESMDLQSQRLDAALKKVASGSDRVLQHQFLTSLENDIRDAESRIKAMEKTKGSVTTPKSEREAAREAIVELTARKDMLRRSKIEFAREAGIKIPDSYDERPSTASPNPRDPLGLFPKK